MFVILCLLASMFLGVAGQIFIKKGLSSLGTVDFSAGLLASYAKIFLSPFVFVGISIYFLGVFFWLYALSKVDLSYAFPFVSLSYILVLVFSSVFLGEHVTILRWAGVLLISAGVALVASS